MISEELRNTGSVDGFGQKAGQQQLSGSKISLPKVADENAVSIVKKHSIV